MTKLDDKSSLIAHLKDLQEKSELWHCSLCSQFLNEDEQASIVRLFPPSNRIKYDGGYENARKKKVIFLNDEEDNFSDIVCLCAKADQRFRKISHRDVLGALMHLQVERSTFGDFWIEDDKIYLYTSESMVAFFIDNLIKINQLTVHFRKIDDRPIQEFKTKKLSAVVASERLDSLVSGITHISRAQAKLLIHEGNVQVNHVVLEEVDKLCDNNDTISIRGYGRFTYLGVNHSTKSGRIVAEFLQYI